MKGLAEYVMLGRRQAIIIVLLSGFLPLLYFFSAAVVALVTLRKGGNEGFLVLLWSLLPAGLMWAMGDTTPVFWMLGSYALAIVLRKTESWQYVMLMATVIGLVTQLSLALQGSYVAQVEQIVSDGLQAQINQGATTEYTAEQIVGLLLSFYGAHHAFMVIICMMLARWWQAALYNPGGFRQEFHNLRFDPRVMIVLLGLILAGLLDIPPMANWLPLFCVAPMFAGLSISHYTVARKTMGGTWLGLIYMTLLMMAPAIILLGMTDSVLDLRKRMERQDDE